MLEDNPDQDVDRDADQICLGDIGGSHINPIYRVPC